MPSRRTNGKTTIANDWFTTNLPKTGEKYGKTKADFTSWVREHDGDECAGACGVPNGCVIHRFLGLDNNTFVTNFFVETQGRGPQSEHEKWVYEMISIFDGLSHASGSVTFSELIQAIDERQED